MVRLIWSKTALNDLKNIAEYIEKDSLQYAKIFVNKLYSSAERLQYFPESGREVPEFHVKEIREIIYQHYRLMYQYDADIVRILTIVHCKRDV